MLTWSLTLTWSTPPKAAGKVAPPGRALGAVPFVNVNVNVKVNACVHVHVHVHVHAVTRFAGCAGTEADRCSLTPEDASEAAARSCEPHCSNVVHSATIPDNQHAARHRPNSTQGQGDTRCPPPRSFQGAWLHCCWGALQPFRRGRAKRDRLLPPRRTLPTRSSSRSACSRRARFGAGGVASPDGRGFRSGSARPCAQAA